MSGDLEKAGLGLGPNLRGPLLHHRQGTDNAGVSAFPPSWTYSVPPLYVFFSASV